MMWVTETKESKTLDKGGLLYNLRPYLEWSPATSTFLESWLLFSIERWAKSTVEIKRMTDITGRICIISRETVSKTLKVRHG